MRENLLLDLAWIDVGAARNVHVGSAAGDVDKPFLVHMAEVAGAKPAVAKRLCVGLWVVVVAREHGGADHADLAGLERFEFTPVVALDRDLHARAFEAAGADAGLRAVLGIVQTGRHHRDVAGDLAETKILHQHRAQLFQRRLLVLAIHRRAGIDHVAQRGVVVFVDRGMLDHHLQDGRHGEHVADAVRFDQAERFGDIEFFGRQQDGRHAARGLHELVHAGAVRQRRDHQRGVALRRAGRQVGQMIGHHKGHLAMGEHRRLGTAGGAGGEEEPAGIVVVDRGVIDFGTGVRRDHLAHRPLAERALTDPPDEFERGIGRGGRMIGKIAVT